MAPPIKLRTSPAIRSFNLSAEEIFSRVSDALLAGNASVGESRSRPANRAALSIDPSRIFRRGRALKLQQAFQGQFGDGR
jgi:hypothetical protein